MTTTTDSMSGKTLFKCDKCRARVALLVENAQRRRLCIDCLPADQQAVFRAPEPK